MYLDKEKNIKKIRQIDSGINNYEFFILDDIFFVKQFYNSQTTSGNVVSDKIEGIILQDKKIKKLYYIGGDLETPLISVKMSLDKNLFPLQIVKLHINNKKTGYDSLIYSKLVYGENQYLCRVAAKKEGIIQVSKDAYKSQNIH